MRVYSGIQPTGTKHLGNHLGAIRRYVEGQEQAAAAGDESIFCVVDLHATTVAYEPAVLRERTRDTAAILLAAGIDPARSILYRQADVPEVAELMWLLTAVTAHGDLNRMHQFKDKGAQQRDLVSAGLFLYPVLMAADVLAFRADLVPVGEDQRQHLELMRDIALRFNARFGGGPDTGAAADADADAGEGVDHGDGAAAASGRPGDVLVVPRGTYPEVASRVMDLQDPTRKMSTSGGSVEGTVHVLDEPAVIEKKLRRAVTDSEDPPRILADRDAKPGVANLLEILAACRRTTPQEEQERLADARGYGDLKAATAEAVVAELAPVRERYAEIRADERRLEDALAAGAARARAIAGPVLAEVRDAMGVGPGR